ncbi:galactose-1-epimerase [Enterovibrio norvegicus FF-454]|uniref:Aldose 1-epimerase n=1 Tax=Enterovibrio norvegicus FF-454 TaxID=1185651 RepID=A0A1E5C0D2_9GAMM|nr:galactose-1-epimerase [Enterovibrio norvegicus]OEE58987.1 galactose-1-epimerase [Enterovibrio norvegicus FF-454]
MTHPLFQSMTQQSAYDGKPAQLVELSNAAGVSVVLMDIGATWLSCRLPIADEERREIILGVARLADFERQQSYMGVTVGRYANRIANGRFNIHDHAYQLTTNQVGNTLHGGAFGFDKVRWRIRKQTSAKVVFSHESPDGDQGFPGNLTVMVTYQLTEDNRIEICYLANTDKATPVNLTNHAYFNLDGAESGADCRDQRLQVNADHYLPTTDLGIPLGELASVGGTGFDFRQPKVIRQDFFADSQQEGAKGYDHSYWFDPSRETSMAVAALSSHDQKVKMSVFTDKPAMQLYSGNWLAGTPNRSGGEYADYAGVALETQFLPDSPHHPEWDQPSCVLEPDQTYRYHTVYAFDF